MTWVSERGRGPMAAGILAGILAPALWIWALVSPVFATPAVQGRLITGSGPVEGGAVRAYRSVDFTSEPAAVSLPSGPDGLYTLPVEPGTWYLAAEAEDLWSWCGQNPVTVSGDETPWIGFILVKWPPPIYRETGEASFDGAVSGTILHNGVPAGDVNVTLYFDEADAFRSMGFLRAPPTGADGRFRIDMVPEGHYFVVARKRESGQGVGPVVKGDLLSYYRYNPVEVVAGRTVEIVLPLVPKRQERDINAAAAPAGKAGFRGTVTDADGHPVPGVHVFAYYEPDMGHHKPAALSSLTDREGRYTISLPGTGRYYVGARSGYGDNPAPGELFGYYQGKPDHSLTLEDGRVLEGVDIVVQGVLVP